MRDFFQDVLNQFSLYFQGLVEIAPKILMAAIILVVAWLFARLIRNMTDKDLNQPVFFFLTPNPAVIRSSIIARITTTRPASKPCPTCNL